MQISNFKINDKQFMMAFSQLFKRLGKIVEFFYKKDDETENT